MDVVFTPQAERTYRKLALNIKKKVDKQFSFLRTNFRHPSLHARKMSGIDVYEARIDIHYRFTFLVEGEMIHILTVGPHDEGLGKK